MTEKEAREKIEALWKEYDEKMSKYLKSVRKGQGEVGMDSDYENELYVKTCARIKRIIDGAD